jgi:hypothetical protein
MAHVRSCQVTKNGVSWGQGVPPSSVTPESEGWVYSTKAGGFATLSETGALLGGSKFDLRPTEDTLGTYSCLLLLDCRHSSEALDLSYGIGLLLRPKPRPTEAQRTYVRMGTVSLASAGIDWLREVERSLVTLV